jgi:hypothetical protein
MRIRIIDVPPGEAPLEIRRAWIGIELPVAGGATSSETASVVGVLTGPSSVFGTLLQAIRGRVGKASGYPVEADAAFEALGRHAPDALEWWRVNTPHLFGQRRCLLFHAHVCEPAFQAGAEDDGGKA